jgi:alkanesulfonate monooxygenase SsuD/methylene tetrahydromethanopterin reductase-like flavin-dependent oxidoreductase (luciferase family)
MADLVRYAEMADAAGADSLWTAEVWRDAFVPLTAMASVAPRARLGTAIAQLARPPWHTEMSAMSLAEVTNGRFVLGLGTAPPTWNEDWHGLTLTKPVTRMREYIECVRTMWTGTPISPVNYAGEFYRVRDYRRFMPAPAAPPPIYLAAVQSRMLQLTGSHTDGWISGPMNSVQYVTTVAQPNLLKGLAAAGRPAAEFERCVMKPCVVHQDAKHARRLARNAIAVYGTLPYYDVVFDPLGFAPATQAIRAAAQCGDAVGMLDAVTDDMLDALVLAGTPDDVRRQATDWEELCDLLILYCPPSLAMEPAETRANHEAIIATFAG